jgi:hypothetical protein
MGTMTPREKAIEAAAKLIYADMPYDGPSLRPKPEWVDGGNSLKQGRARLNARVYVDAYLAALEAAGGAKRGSGYSLMSDRDDWAIWTKTKPSFEDDCFPVLIIKL